MLAASPAERGDAPPSEVLLPAKLHLWGAQSERPLPCKTEVISLSPADAVWQQPSSSSNSLPLGTAENWQQPSVSVESPGLNCSSFNLLLQQLASQHLREVCQVRAELERKLEDLGKRIDGNTQDVQSDGAVVSQNHADEVTQDVRFQDEAAASCALPQYEPARPVLNEPSSHYSQMAKSIVQRHFFESLARMRKSGWFNNMQRKPSDRPHSRLIKCIKKVEKSQLFDAVCALMIILNATLMGISTDVCARNSNPNESPEFFSQAHWTFSTWFLFEVSVRMLAHGLVQYFCGAERKWNIFDFVMVTTDLVEIFATLVRGSSAVVQKIAAIRMLRMLRVIRTIRVIRLARFFKELRMMVYSVLKSGLLLLWSMIWLAIIIFIFSVYLTQNVTFYVSDHKDDGNELIDKLQTNFGSLTFAAYILFQCMSGGVSWGEVSDPLLEIHWSNGLVLMFFIFFTVFAVLNVIAGIFVETAIRSAQADRHEIIQEAMHFEDTALYHMQQFLRDTDLDHSGTITLKELKQQLANPQMRRHLKHLGIEVSDATSIFRLLDRDRTGEINIEEYIFGCLEMQGSAKSIDLITLIHENRRLKSELSDFFSLVRDNVQQQQSFQKKLDSILFQ